MSAHPPIIGVVLTRNEAIHIRRCLESARRVCNVIYVVDSRSVDGTAAIAETEGAIVIPGDFTSFAQKLNWAIDMIEVPTDGWMMRIDADEVLSEALVAGLPDFLATLPASVSGVHVRRRLWFMGQPMRFGGVYPRHSMRLWRPRAVHCEIRALDEHMLLKTGTAATFEADVDDIPLTSLSLWIAKHNEYSTLEASTALASRDVAGTAGGAAMLTPRLFGDRNQRIRWLKEKLFYRIPPFVRPFLYFFHRYVILGGFLDGKAGLIFHVLHGFWYRFLVDAKIVEARGHDPARH
ncbi:glycosyltransferase family 2 protein [Sphingomonas sp. GV3]|uniref:glycosyltransferase family 2 protein n=1 Tax=Sphingomonas sp. GV3 TaxID=3040671 RepID=UPI00280ACBEB|nr:glycosyltransferase family 2 protein [Sphingomonas sp. GV3]